MTCEAQLPSQGAMLGQHSFLLWNSCSATWVKVHLLSYGSYGHGIKHQLLPKNLMESASPFLKVDPTTIHSQKDDFTTLSQEPAKWISVGGTPKAGGNDCWNCVKFLGISFVLELRAPGLAENSSQFTARSEVQKPKFQVETPGTVTADEENRARLNLNSRKTWEPHVVYFASIYSSTWQVVTTQGPPRFCLRLDDTIDELHDLVFGLTKAYKWDFQVLKKNSLNLSKKFSRGCSGTRSGARDSVCFYPQ